MIKDLLGIYAVLTFISNAILIRLSEGWPRIICECNKIDRNQGKQGACEERY